MEEVIEHKTCVLISFFFGGGGGGGAQILMKPKHCQ